MMESIHQIDIVQNFHAPNKSLKIQLQGEI